MFLGTAFVLLNACCFILLTMVYHAGKLSNSELVASIALCLLNFGFLISLTFIQRLIFIGSILLFSANILSSSAFNISNFNHLAPFGGMLGILGWFSLIIFRRL